MQWHNIYHKNNSTTIFIVYRLIYLRLRYDLCLRREVCFLRRVRRARCLRRPPSYELAIARFIASILAI